MSKTIKEIDDLMPAFREYHHLIKNREYDEEKFINDIKHRLILFRLSLLDEVERNLINNLKFDEQAHIKGDCSFSSLALCSAEEHNIKNQIKTLFSEIRKGK